MDMVSRPVTSLLSGERGTDGRSTDSHLHLILRVTGAFGMIGSDTVQGVYYTKEGTTPRFTGPYAMQASCVWPRSGARDNYLGKISHASEYTSNLVSPSDLISIRDSLADCLFSAIGIDFNLIIAAHDESEHLPFAK